MDLKCPKSFIEQIEELQNHNIEVPDVTKAEQVLREINYYRLSGYALQFRKSSNDSDCIDGTTFDSICDIYTFDQDLRNLLRRYLEILEIYLKTQIAHGFSMAKCLTPPHDQHYLENNFYNKKGYQEVMDSFKKDKNYYRDSLIYQHHKNKYGSKMPLWAMVELLSFANVSKLYNAMYFSEKDIIANALGIGAKTLVNHMHCMAVLRNRCAHCARLYNTSFNPPAHFTSNYLKKHPEVKQDTLFAYAIVLAKRLPNEYKIQFINDLIKMISDNINIDISLIGFPDNYSDLLKALL